LIAALFPGQGSQTPGMAKEIINNFAYVNDIFTCVSDRIGIDVLRLCTDASNEELTLTENTQPALLTMGIALWTIKQREESFNAKVFMGHSLGEYTALVAAGILALEDAAFLVRERGLAMQKAVPVGVGAMAAILVQTSEEVQNLCEEQMTQDPESGYVGIANFNSPTQNVIAGQREAVLALSARCKKAIPLNVSAPFHTPLMRPAREHMAPLIEATVFKTPALPDCWVVPNINAKPTQNYAKEFLIEQVDGAVQWTQSVLAAKELGVSDFVEIGPGRVLSGLLKKILF
jgi:[acyl-carrier-protein] S-malonyltransferase